MSTKTKVIKVRGRTAFGRSEYKKAVNRMAKKGYTLTHQERGTLGAQFLTFTKES